MQVSYFFPEINANCVSLQCVETLTPTVAIWYSYKASCTCQTGLSRHL